VHVIKRVCSIEIDESAREVNSGGARLWILVMLRMFRGYCHCSNQKIDHAKMLVVLDEVNTKVYSNDF
jgi:hypothetical protein